MNKTPSEVDIKCFINKGPDITKIPQDKLFTSENLLGVPLETEIHSSIDAFYRYGFIVFYDETGARETRPITANDIITLVFRNQYRNLEESVDNTIIHFNIFDIEEIQYDPNAFNSRKFTGKLYKFHLVEAPFFLKYNDKSFKVAFGSDDGKTVLKEKINNIIKKHFKENLKLITDDPKKDFIQLDLDETASEMHFLVPSWKTQKLLSYLLEFAKDYNNCGNMKLWTTTDNKTGKPIVHLRSINNLMLNASKKKNSPAVIFTHVASGDLKGTPDAVGIQSINSILTFKFSFYDLTSITTGLPGATLLNFDYKTGRYFVHHNTYIEANKKQENSYMSNYAMWKDSISSSETKQFYFGPMDTELAKDYLTNKLIKNRYQLKADIMTYIDEKIYPGDTVICTFPSGTAEASRGEQTQLFDEHVSDQWLVEETVDIIKNGKGGRKMVLMKDSYFNLYGNTDGKKAKDALPKVNYINKK